MILQKLLWSLEAKRLDFLEEIFAVEIDLLKQVGNELVRDGEIQVIWQMDSHVVLHGWLDRFEKLFRVKMLETLVTLTDMIFQELI